MKSVKTSLILWLLIMALFSNLGHELIDHYAHVADLIEHSAGSKNSVKAVIHDSSCDNDHFFTIPGNTSQHDFPCLGKILRSFPFSPGNLNSAIWLPPELS